MPTFLWEATTKGGDYRSGEIAADTEEELRQRLTTQGLQVSKIKRKPLDIQLPTIGTGVSLKDMVVFSRTFSTMIDAGLPVVQCLDMLGSQSENPHFGKILMGVKAEVESGKSLSEGLSKYPRVFDDLFVNLVAAGEAGGILDLIFRRLAAYLEKAEKLRRQVRGAMVYPAGIISVGFGVITLMLTFVLPTFEKMFADLGAGQLPAPTRVVIALSHFFVDYWYIIFGSIGLGIFGIVSAYRTPKGRIIFDNIILRSPVIGNIVRKGAVARFTRTMGTLLSSGVNLLEALDIVARTSGNEVVKQAILQTREKVSQGSDIATPLIETQVFPPMVCQMIGVGEQTGAMDEMLQKIADFYEDEVDAAVSAMTALIEPLILVFLGVGVGGLLIAMYLPIFNIAGSIKT